MQITMCYLVFEKQSRFLSEHLVQVRARSDLWWASCLPASWAALRLIAPCPEAARNCYATKRMMCATLWDRKARVRRCNVTVTMCSPREGSALTSTIPTLPTACRSKRALSWTWATISCTSTSPCGWSSSAIDRIRHTKRTSTARAATLSVSSSCRNRYPIRCWCHAGQELALATTTSALIH